MANVHYLHTPMAKDADQLPNRIRYWRKQRGLTLQQLGDAIGKTKGSVGHLELGIRPLSDHDRFAIARVLEVEPADLYLEAEMPNVVPVAEREFWKDYLSLDAPLRRAVREHTSNLRAWKSEPPAEDDSKSA